LSTGIRQRRCRNASRKAGLVSVQKPHPQLWEPLTSTRSLKFAAEHGINGVMIAEPNDRLRRNIEIY